MKNNPLVLDKRSKIAFLLFLLLFILSVGFSFYKYFMVRNYSLETQVDCDPTSEKCFVWECNPDSSDDADKCTGDSTSDTHYYKLIEKNASHLSRCRTSDPTCPPIVCDKDEAGCTYTYCEEGSAEGVPCSTEVPIVTPDTPQEDVVIPNP